MRRGRLPLALLFLSPVLLACHESVTSADVAPLDPTAAVAMLDAVTLTASASVGQRIFNDENLSLHRNQSCATCHDRGWGFSSPRSRINEAGSVMPGSVPTRFGTRRPPSAAYATAAPIRYFDSDEGIFIGGNFWDGRATGARLGSPAAEQALGPFLNPVEQALPDPACVLHRIRTGSYLANFTRAFGDGITRITFPPETDGLCAQEGTSVPLGAADRLLVQAEYDNVGRAVAAFEASPIVNQFSSKYDAVLDGVASFTPEEAAGLALYQGKANCAACHPNAGKRALFTDFTFDNIGVPPNPENPALLANPSFRDLGLGASVGMPHFNGAQKVPTLRNTDKRGRPDGVKAFMHNGAFKSLEQVVHFYNTRDVKRRCDQVSRPQFGVNCWPRPEVRDNVNTDELGNLGLTSAEERALVAFIRTLNDGYYRPVNH